MTVRIVSETEFAQRIRTVLYDHSLANIGAVTGPGRSGAIAAVYASHIRPVHPVRRHLPGQVRSIDHRHRPGERPDASKVGQLVHEAHGQEPESHRRLRRAAARGLLVRGAQATALPSRDKVRSMRRTMGEIIHVPERRPPKVAAPLR